MRDEVHGRDRDQRGRVAARGIGDRGRLEPGDGRDDEEERERERADDRDHDERVEQSLVHGQPGRAVEEPALEIDVLLRLREAVVDDRREQREHEGAPSCAEHRLAPHSRAVGPKTHAAVFRIGVEPAGRAVDALLLDAAVRPADAGRAAHEELDRGEARERPRDDGEELAAGQPDLRPEHGHRDQLERDVGEDDDREREWLLGRVPDELHPAPEEDERGGRPEAEPLRIADGARAAEGEGALERSAGGRERADEVPRVSHERGHDPEPDPEVDPDDDRGRVLEEVLRPEEPADEDVDEGEREDDEPDRPEVQPPDRAVEVAARPGGVRAHGEHRRGGRGEHRHARREGEEPDRKREAVVDPRHRVSRRRARHGQRDRDQGKEGETCPASASHRYMDGLISIGVPGFEPGTSPTRTARATRLRYTPRLE